MNDSGNRLSRRFRLVKRKAIDWQAAHVSPASMVLLISFIVGILSGLSAVALKWFINVLGHYFKAGLNPYGPNLHLLCYPLAGILLVSVFQRYVLKKDYSRSTYMLSLAIASGRYRMTKSSILNSVLTCGLTIGFGCTAGSEGPVAYSGAAIGSNVGRWLGLSDQWLRILIGIGAGAGIAGIFKSPTGGVLFTLEVLQLPMQTIPVIGLFIACILSGTTAKVFSDFSFDMMFSSVRGFDPSTLGWIALFGIFCGLYSMLYNRLKNCSGKFFLSVADPWHRNIMAGTALSLTLFIFPCLFGEGMGVLESAINGQGIDLFSYGPFAGRDLSVGVVLLCCAAVLLLKGPLVAAALRRRCRRRLYAYALCRMFRGIFLLDVLQCVFRCRSPFVVLLPCRYGSGDGRLAPRPADGPLHISRDYGQFPVHAGIRSGRFRELHHRETPYPTGLERRDGS